MGNCQAVDAAALVVQHPCGKVERMYWPVAASEVMKMNPGHHVSLIIPLPVSEQENREHKTVRFTRVKLLRPNETLNLGHAYRLIPTQEVMQILKAKKNAKTKKVQIESVEKSQRTQEKESSGCEKGGQKSDTVKTYQAMRAERQRLKTPSMNSTSMRSKAWRPSLQSISESAS